MIFDELLAMHCKSDLLLCGTLQSGGAVLCIGGINRHRPSLLSPLVARLEGDQLPPECHTATFDVYWNASRTSQQAHWTDFALVVIYEAHRYERVNLLCKWLKESCGICVALTAIATCPYTRRPLPTITDVIARAERPILCNDAPCQMCGCGDKMAIYDHVDRRDGTLTSPLCTRCWQCVATASAAATASSSS